MTVKELLDILECDFETHDPNSRTDKNKVLCKYIKRAKCKQSELLNKLYNMVNVLSYVEIDGNEKAAVDWSGFINHNIKTFETFTNIWGSKLIRFPGEDGLVSLWIEEFNRLSEPIADEDFCMDLLKLISGCEKASQSTDGILTT